MFLLQRFSSSLPALLDECVDDAIDQCGHFLRIVGRQSDAQDFRPEQEVGLEGGFQPFDGVGIAAQAADILILEGGHQHHGALDAWQPSSS